MFELRKKKRMRQRQASQERAKEERVKQTLQTLTEDEKKIISKYTSDHTIHQYLDPYNPISLALTNKGIITPDGVIFLCDGWKQTFLLTPPAIKHIYGDHEVRSM